MSDPCHTRRQVCLRKTGRGIRLHRIRTFLMNCLSVTSELFLFSILTKARTAKIARASDQSIRFWPRSFLLSLLKVEYLVVVVLAVGFGYVSKR